MEKPLLITHESVVPTLNVPLSLSFDVDIEVFAFCLQSAWLCFSMATRALLSSS